MEYYAKTTCSTSSPATIHLEIIDVIQEFEQEEIDESIQEYFEAQLEDEEEEPMSMMRAHFEEERDISSS